MWNARRARSYNEELEIGYPGDDFLGNRYETNNFSDEDNPDEQDPVTTPQWVQLDVETPNEIDEEVQASYHQYVQLVKQFNWDQILKKMHAVYMVQKLRTNNWTSENTYNSFSNCKCYTHSNQPVDLIDIYGQRPTNVSFCSYTPDAIQLLQQVYVAGSPVRPQTAFSLPLLIFHNHLWNNCHVGMMPFTLGLTEWLEPRSKRLCAKNQDHARDIRKPFSAAVDIFRQLEDISNEIYKFLLPHRAPLALAHNLLMQMTTLKKLKIALLFSLEETFNTGTIRRQVGIIQN
ncbi:hypothetical protein PCASD_11496 [Puccinia coronata f. sp. avenae]|uniref:CxC1-like cysteine cluster associated with KDZ transposases domain-containing protein n=1 Tax=Puccinia coronata f. sp. avenae TaxID=200324 RepID=A0A2N5V392_9BASI|nr:hypothetical protein PCASD_11496 [Puccinia coronata f. sp. avenae]